MRTYKGNLPLNANVVVDYTKKEEDIVRFDYPIVKSYKKAVWKEVYLTIVSLWLKILLLILYLSSLIYAIYKLSLVAGTNISPSSFPTLLEVIYCLIPYIITIYIFLGIPAIVTYYLSLDREKLAKYMPMLGLWSTTVFGKIKVNKFIPEDVSYKELKIHKFSNILMDYKATGDFSKYLKRVEVKDISFCNFQTEVYIAFKHVRNIKNKKNKRQNRYFSARFVFSKTPKKGSLTVKYI